MSELFLFFPLEGGGNLSSRELFEGLGDGGGLVVEKKKGGWG